MCDSNDEEEGGPPVMHVRTLSLTNGVNRIRAMPQKPAVVAVWEDAGQVEVSSLFTLRPYLCVI